MTSLSSRLVARQKGHHEIGPWVPIRVDLLGGSSLRFLDSKSPRSDWGSCHPERPAAGSLLEYTCARRGNAGTM